MQYKKDTIPRSNVRSTWHTILDQYFTRTGVEGSYRVLIWFKSLSMLTCGSEPSTCSSEYLYHKWSQKTSYVTGKLSIEFILCAQAELELQRWAFLCWNIYTCESVISHRVSIVRYKSDNRKGIRLPCILRARGTMPSFAIYKIVGEVHLCCWLSSTKAMSRRRKP